MARNYTLHQTKYGYNWLLLSKIAYKNANLTLYYIRTGLSRARQIGPGNEQSTFSLDI